MATPEIEALQALAGYAGSGGTGMATMFLFYKFIEKRRTKDYQSNGKDRRNGNGNGKELSDSLKKLAGAVDVKAEVTNISGLLKNMETTISHLSTTVDETKANIGNIWDQTNKNANSIAEIKGYLEGKSK